MLMWYNDDENSLQTQTRQHNDLAILNLVLELNSLCFLGIVLFSRA